MGIVYDEMKRLREAAGLNQKELAASLNLTPAFVNDLERERRGPSIATATKILKTLKTTKPEARTLIREWSGGWVELFEQAGGK